MCYTVFMLQQTSHYQPSASLYEAPSTDASLHENRSGNKRGRANLALYLSAPNHCANSVCGRPILPHAKERLTDTRKRRFCSRSCAASVNNQAAVAPKRKATVSPCATCGAPLRATDRAAHRSICGACHDQEMWRLGSTSVSDVTPLEIKRHACYILEGRMHPCIICGYGIHTQIVHLHSPASFSPTTPLRVVNDPQNLTHLCPNHAWEHGHGRVSEEFLSAAAKRHVHARGQDVETAPATLSSFLAASPH